MTLAIRATVIALSMLAASLVLPAFSQEARGANIAWNADQSVSGTQSFNGDVITLTGNLTISGTLTFTNTELKMNGASNGQYHIEVLPGGTFTVVSGSRIHSNTVSNYLFWVRAGSNVQMDASTFEDCGYELNGVTNWGLYLQSNSTTVSNCTIRNNYAGIVVDNASTPLIYRNTITSNDCSGVLVLNGAAPVIDNNNINTNVKNTNMQSAGGIYSGSSSPIITNNTIAANIDTLNEANSQGIYLQGAGTPKVMHNTITGHTDTSEWSWGILVIQSQPYIFNNTIRGNSNGIFLNNGNSIVNNNIIDGNFKPSTPDNAGYGLADQSSSLAGNNTYTNGRIGVFLVDAAHTSFDNEKISTMSWAGVAGDPFTTPFQVTMTNCTLSSNRFDVNFNKILGGGKGGSLVFVNCAHSNGSVWINDTTTTLQKFWFLRVKITMESTGLPVDEAKVKLYDRKGGATMVVLTKPDGWTGTLMLEELTHATTSNESKAPYNITGEKSGRTNWTVEVFNRSVDIQLALDDIAPWMRIDTPQNNTVSNKTSINLTGMAEPGALVMASGVRATTGPAGNWSVTVPLPVEGSNTITVETTDRGFNKVSAVIIVLRDTTAPDLTVSGPENNFLTNLTKVTVTGATNDRSGKTVINGKDITVANDGSFSALVDIVEGTNTLVIQSMDACFNTATVVRNVERDTVAPSITMTTPADGTVLNATSVAVRGYTEADCLVTVEGKQVAIVNGNFSSIISLKEGANTVTITSQDIAGNVKYATLLIVRDSTGPVLKVTSHKNEQVVNATLVVIEGTTEEGSLVKVNGNGVSVNGNLFAAEVRLTMEGRTTFTIEAFDALKNRAEITITLVLDTSPPELKITSPLPNTVTGQSVYEVRGKSEPFVNVSIDDAYAVSDSKGLFSINVSLATEGLNTFTITGWDAGWNIVEETFTITRDTRLYFNVTAPRNNDKVKRSNLTVSGNAEPGTTITVNGMPVSQLPDGKFVSEVLLTLGVNTITFTLKDKAGNSATYSVNVTRVNPSTPPKPAIPGFEVVLLLGAIVVAVVLYRRR